MDLLSYLHLQMELEGLRVDSGGFRVAKMIPGEDPPLILTARLADGQTVVCPNRALPAGIFQAVQACARAVALPDVEPLANLLKAYGVAFTLGHYVTCTFPESYLRIRVEGAGCYAGDDPRIKQFHFDGIADKVYAVEQEGRIVSACVSVRQNARCAESWVYTAPDYRRKGYAALAVSAWAQATLRAGVTPFYSYAIDNTASAALAQRLGLDRQYEEFNFNPPGT